MIRNIVFVCSGNACRSPLAETILRKMLRENGVEGVEVWSCGTLDWGTNPRDAQMVLTAQAMGYALTGTTRPMLRDDLMKADLIVVFQLHHRDALTRVLDYAHWDRILLFDEIAFGQSTEVEDPHFQSEALYCRVAQHIEAGCRNITTRLKGYL